MGTVIANPEVRFTANSGEYAAAMRDIRSSTETTTASFVSMGGLVGEQGEVMADGLRTSTREVTHLAGAFGAAGGEGTRFTYALTAIVLEGLNPLALGVVAVGVGVNLLIDYFKESSKEAEKAAAEGLKAYHEELKKTEEQANRTSDETQKLLEKLQGLKTGVPAEEIGIQNAIAKQQKLMDAAAGKTIAGGNATQWYQEELRLEANIRDLKRAGYADDSREVENQQRLVDLAEENYRKLQDEVDIHKREMGLLQDKLRALRDVTTEEKAQKLEKERELAIDGASHALAAKKTEESKAAAREASKQLSEMAKGLGDLDHENEKAWGYGKDAVHTYDVMVRQAKEDVHDATSEISHANEETRKLAASEHARFVQGEKDDARWLEMYTEAADRQRQAFEKTDAITGWDTEMQKLTVDSQLYGVVAAHVADTITHDFSSGVAGALIDIQTHSKTAQVAFKELATSIVFDFERMIIEALAFRAITSAIGFGGGISTATASATSAINTRTASLAASEASSTAKSMRVEIHSHGTPQRIDSALQDSGPDGARRLKVMISDVVAEDMATGGKASRAAAGAFGLSRTTRRR